MEIVQLDAREIMAHEKPVSYLASRFGVQADQLEHLISALQNAPTFRQVEVYHWPVSHPQWTDIANALESVQQKSEYFFLVWGANDKWEHSES